MKMIKQTFVSLAIVLTGVFGTAALVAQPVGAASGTSCAILPASICSNAGQGHGGTAIWNLLLMVLNIMTAGVGVAAVIGVIIAAIQYSSAEEKADQVHSAKMRIWNIILGLVLYLVMYAFLQFLIPGGVFS